MVKGLHLPPRHRQEIVALLHKHLPSVEVWAYGSRVNGRSHDGSDLDLVLRGPKLTEIDTSRLVDFIEALQDSTIPFLVEARDWARLPESFHHEVEREHVVLVEREERDVADEWREAPLGDLLSFANGKSSPRRSNSLLHPVYGSNGIIGFSNEANAEKNTIIVGRVGSYCGSLYYSDRDCWVTDNAIRANAIDGHKARFLFFLLQTLRLNDRRAGSGQPLLNQTILSSIPVTVPPLPEQRAIAHILGTLDDKIELNRRMNETLEAMARALFKSWFVDFDPVRAKMADRDTGLPQHLADLFPDRMVESELGEIPEGWQVKSLGDLLELAYGKALKADSRNDGEVPVYGSNGEVGWHDKRLVQGPGIVVGRKGNPGVVTWAITDFFPIDTTFYVVPKDSNQNLYFLFYALKGQDLPSIAADSAVPGLNRNLAYMNKQVMPVDQIVEHFNGYVDPIFARSHCLGAESRTLAFLRDALLPKLISGEIRLRDVDKQAKTVV